MHTRAHSPDISSRESAHRARQRLDSYVSPRELRDLTGLSEATIWRLRRRGELPDPIRLSPGRVAWSERTIADWLARRADR